MARSGKYIIDCKTCQRKTTHERLKLQDYGLESYQCLICNYHIFRDEGELLGLTYERQEVVIV